MIGCPVNLTVNHLIVLDLGILRRAGDAHFKAVGEGGAVLGMEHGRHEVGHGIGILDGDDQLMDAAVTTGALDGEHDLLRGIRRTDGPLLAGFVVIAHITQDVIATVSSAKSEINLLDVLLGYHFHGVAAIQTNASARVEILRGIVAVGSLVKAKDHAINVKLVNLLLITEVLLAEVNSDNRVCPSRHGQQGDKEER